MRAFIIISVITLAIACNRNTNSKQTVNTGNEKIALVVDNSVHGKWELYKTVCCGRTSQETLVKYDEPKQYLKFNTKKMQLKQFEMGYLKSKSNFKFTKLNDTDKDPSRYIQLEDEGSPYMYTIKEDELIMSRGYMDLETKYYKRVK